MEAYNDISINHANGNSFLHGHIAKDQPQLFLNLQSFTNCSMKFSIRYNFCDWFGRHWQWAFYTLNICFSCRFPYTDGKSFSRYKPLEHVNFGRSISCRLFSRIWYSPFHNNSGKDWGCVSGEKASKKITLSSLHVKKLHCFPKIV